MGREICCYSSVSSPAHKQTASSDDEEEEDLTRDL